MPVRLIFLCVMILVAGSGYLIFMLLDQPNLIEFEVKGVITKIYPQNVSVDDVDIHAVMFLDGKPINDQLTMPKGIAIIDETIIQRTTNDEGSKTINWRDLQVGDRVHCWIVLKTDHVVAAKKILLK